ncbi:MAG: hypothetical protein II882_00510 [Lachnospiraceae bacterium]|nr:hypothetical protein [Lachnospiraceae bacterium]
MDIWKRLLRRPLNTLLWLLLAAVMSAFLLVGISLRYSTSRLLESLKDNNMAIAVRSDQLLEGEGRFPTAEERYFTEEDRNWLESLDSVEAVRIHALSAASSPSFTPVLEMDQKSGYRANGNMLPYSYAAFAGECCEIRDSGRSVAVTLDLKKILLLGEEYERCGARRVLEEAGRFTAYIDTEYSDLEFDPAHPEELIIPPSPATYFEVGRTYIFAGCYDPGRKLFPAVRQGDVYKNQLLYLGNLVWGEDMLLNRNILFLPGSMGPNSAQISQADEAYTLPAAERWDGDPEDFFNNTEHEIWRSYRDAWMRQMHSLPVIGTEYLETMYAFLTDRAKITEGRSFTAEEYETGAGVLILSKKLAEQCGLKVGDTLRLSQYLCLYGQAGQFGTNESRFLMKPGEYYNDPSVDALCTAPLERRLEEEFTVVGLYELLSDWSYGPYDFGPNTVFIPKKAQMDGAFGEIPKETGGRDIYGMLLSVELKSGHMNDFNTALENSPYKREFFAFDQGFEDVQKNVRNMRASMTRLMVLSAAGWGVFLLLFVLMFQGSEKKNIGTMRSLGVTRARTCRYLAGSGLIVAAAGTLIGIAAGSRVIRTVQESILRDAAAGLDHTLEAEQLAASEAEIAKLLSAGSLGPAQLAAAAGAALLILCLALMIHSVILCRRSSRKLMEG